MLRFFAHSSLVLAALSLAANLSQSAETVDLSPKFEPGQIMRVSIDFEAGGNQLVRTVAPVTDQNGATSSDERQLPASVVATLQYDERRLAAPRSDAPRPGTQLALRYYQRAEE